MGVRLAPRFAIRLVVRDASNVAGQRAAALWDALNRIDSHPPADADLQGWHQKVRQAVGDRGVAEALGEQAPECASCSPKRRRGGKVVDEVGICALISGAICRANERYRKLLKRATGVWPPIRVGVVEGEGPTEPQFGLPFAAWTTCDPSRSRIHLQFSEDWLDAREGNRLLPPDEKTQTGLAYAVFHEMQHALDHALKRPSSFAGSIDHVFADGWMDFAASVLCLDDSPATDSKARRDAVAAIRKERNSASDVQRSERARVAERRQLGTLAASTFLDLVDAGYIEGGGTSLLELHDAPPCGAANDRQPPGARSGTALACPGRPGDRAGPGRYAQRR